MTAVLPTLEWSESEPAIVLANVDVLDRSLDVIAKRCATDHPTIVKIYSRGYTLTFGLGSPETFVQLSEPDDQAPYLVSVGDGHAEGKSVFYFHDEHHTEIPRRHLIPSTSMRQVVREVFASGRRSPDITWEEVGASQLPMPPNEEL
jgi:hypothetical protein